MAKAQSLSDRLWKRVEKSDGCWIWTGFQTSQGYGLIGVGGVAKKTHRVAYELTTGVIPDGLCVLHRCDNPPCVNPAHLFIGTVADNNADMKAKGRYVGPRLFGERNGHSKLTSAQVIAIRSDTRLQREIAAAYGLDPSTVSYIRGGQSWKHL